MTAECAARPSQDHLLPDVRKMLDWPVAERLAYVEQDKWLNYPAAQAAINAMSDLLARPAQVRMRGVLVTARPNNGKTALLKRFGVQNRPTLLESGSANTPVVRVWSPDEASEAKLWSQLLKALKQPHRSSDSARHLREQAMRTIEFQGVRMLMFDELHNILNGSSKKTQHLLTLLKMLVNELSVRIVVAGTADVVRALTTDQQLATRFDCFSLPTWTMTDGLRTILKGLESTLPLPERSNLGSDDMLRLMSTKANGTIGGYVKQVQSAAGLAIKSAKPMIDTSLIVKAQGMSGVDIADLKTEH